MAAGREPGGAALSGPPAPRLPASQQGFLGRGAQPSPDWPQGRPAGAPIQCKRGAGRGKGRVAAAAARLACTERAAAQEPGGPVSGRRGGPQDGQQDHFL